MMNNSEEELLLLLVFGSGLESLDQCHSSLCCITGNLQVLDGGSSSWILQNMFHILGSDHPPSEDPNGL